MLSETQTLMTEAARRLVHERIIQPKLETAAQNFPTKFCVNSGPKAYCN